MKVMIETIDTAGISGYKFLYEDFLRTSVSSIYLSAEFLPITQSLLVYPRLKALLG